MFLCILFKVSVPFALYLVYNTFLTFVRLIVLSQLQGIFHHFRYHPVALASVNLVFVIFTQRHHRKQITRFNDYGAVKRGLTCGACVGDVCQSRFVNKSVHFKCSLLIN